MITQMMFHSGNSAILAESDLFCTYCHIIRKIARFCG